MLTYLMKRLHRSADAVVPEKSELRAALVNGLEARPTSALRYLKIFKNNPMQSREVRSFYYIYYAATDRLEVPSF